MLIGRFNHEGHLKQQKEAEELQAWREKNSKRLRWEMFLRNFGPEGDFDHLGEMPVDAEEEAAFAHREVETRIGSMAFSQALLKTERAINGEADIEPINYASKNYHAQKS
jgi:hypothetical protein